MSWERSATICAKEKSRSSVVPSWASSPFTQVRTRSASGSTAEAGIRAGPNGVKPSPDFERMLDPLSAYFMSYTPRSLEAVTEPTWLQASSTETRRASVPMTRAISPSKASSSVPAGRSTVSPEEAKEDDAFMKYDGNAGVRPRWAAREE
jgi:hypothetical protein